MSAYHYTECGLTNVFIENMVVAKTDDEQEAYVIRNIRGLHKAIACLIVEHSHSISGPEIRFLRTEMGYTQDELAALVHRDRQAIGHWERGEIPIDNNAEAVIRMLAIQKLGLAGNVPVEEVSARCVSGTANDKIRIDGSNPDDYTPLRAA